jgi:hypothetical protein
MKWRPFSYRGSDHDLSHLHPFEWQFMAPASETRPARTYPIQAIFSLHTFTRGIQGGLRPAAELIYRDTREEREFDFARYELSKQLPAIVRSLGERTCYHTAHGTFFTIELTGPEGSRQDYEVYFKASRANRRGWLNLYVQSAYVRDSAHRTTQPKKRKISFHAIAYNVLQGRPTKPGK